MIKKDCLQMNLIYIFLLFPRIFETCSSKALHHAMSLQPRQGVHKHDTGPDHCLSYKRDGYPGQPDIAESQQIEKSLRP